MTVLDDLPAGSARDPGIQVSIAARLPGGKETESITPGSHFILSAFKSRLTSECNARRSAASSVTAMLRAQAAHHIASWPAPGRAWWAGCPGAGGTTAPAGGGKDRQRCGKPREVRRVNLAGEPPLCPENCARVPYGRGEECGERTRSRASQAGSGGTLEGSGDHAVL
jgi:hypothetical protein